jgi:soluble lytic murein transglycosylase
MRAMKAFAADYLSLPIEHAPRRYWEALFPLPWRRDIEANARLRNLDPFLVAGLIRQESEFNPAAKSGANAYGLMQVRPGTAREAARRAGVPKFSTRLLTQPAVNVKLGTYILRGMLDSHDGRVEETLAAYNAGPARAADWRTWATFREPAEFIETIPFTETRDYVQAVLRNAEMYRRLYR